MKQSSTAIPTPTHEDLLKGEVKRLASISTITQLAIKEAKTNTKKKYFLKKLKKNNTILADMLMRLDRVTKDTSTPDDEED